MNTNFLNLIKKKKKYIAFYKFVSNRQRRRFENIFEQLPVTKKGTKILQPGEISSIIYHHAIQHPEERFACTFIFTIIYPNDKFTFAKMEEEIFYWIIK